MKRVIDIDEDLYKAIKNNDFNMYGGRIYEMIRNSKLFKQEPFINKPCVSSGVCEHDKNKVLDKIKDEITEKENKLGFDCVSDVALKTAYIEVLQIIDKYAESED